VPTSDPMQTTLPVGTTLPGTTTIPVGSTVPQTTAPLTPPATNSAGVPTR
jgi:hypothetical protein